jgi:uncharacterized membrane protein
MVAIFLVVGVVVGGSMLPLLWGKSASTNVAQIGLGLLLGTLVFLALIVPVLMATWFAPALVLFDRLAAIDAMKLSFGGCLRNLVPFLLYGVIGCGLLIVAAIPLGLGLLILSPVLIASVYTSYCDIFDRRFAERPAGG